MQEIRRTGSSWMDRRSFIAKAGLLTAGSAMGGTVLGCSDSEINIPCLGPASAPVPVAGMTYVRASQIGCGLDCDLRNGRNKHTGGKATDDGPRINAAMASASASNPITLIIDGSALISGLFLPAAFRLIPDRQFLRAERMFRSAISRSTVIKEAVGAGIRRVERRGAMSPVGFAASI